MISSIEINLSLIVDMSDDEAIKYLSTLPGIGIWTAEMLLLFCYQRTDIVSYNDLIIRRGIENLYNIENLSKKEFFEIRKNYSPYGSVASFYIWHAGNSIK